MGIKGTFYIMVLACVVFTVCFIMIRSKGASIYALMAKAMAILVTGHSKSVSICKVSLLAMVLKVLGMRCSLVVAH